MPFALKLPLVICIGVEVPLVGDRKASALADMMAWRVVVQDMQGVLTTKGRDDLYQDMMYVTECCVSEDEHVLSQARNSWRRSHALSLPNSTSGI